MKQLWSTHPHRVCVVVSPRFHERARKKKGHSLLKVTAPRSTPHRKYVMEFLRVKSSLIMPETHKIVGVRRECVCITGVLVEYPLQHKKSRPIHITYMCDYYYFAHEHAAHARTLCRRVCAHYAVARLIRHLMPGCKNGDNIIHVLLIAHDHHVRDPLNIPYLLLP